MDKLKIGSPEMKEAGRVAAAILDLYENKGWKWVQGYCGDDTAKCACLYGAEALTERGSVYAHTGDITSFAKTFSSRYNCRAVVSFNDKPGRTYKQIKAALKKIIAASKL